MFAMEKLPVGKRILATFLPLVALLALALVAGLVVLARVGATSGRLVELRLPDAASVATIHEATTDAARALLALGSDRLPDEHRGRLFRAAAAAFERMDREWRAFDGREKDEGTTRAFAELQRPWAEWRRAAEATLAAERARDASPAGTGSRKDANEAVVAAILAHDQAYEAVAPHLRGLVAAVQRQADVEGASSRALVRRASVGLTLAFVALTALVLAVGLALARAPSRLIAGLSGRLERLAAGELPDPVTEAGGEDLDRLRDSFNSVVASLRGFVEQVNRMSDAHARGDIDAAIDERPFSGEYRAMAEGVNRTVAAHVALERQAMEIFAEFGRGNFDASLEPLPGAKRFINDTVEQVRRNLNGLIAEVDRVSAEHDRGEVDAVIDEGRFPGDYQTMARGVNEMLAANLSVTRKALDAFAGFGRGDFEVPLEPFPGKRRVINEVAEQVRANLRALAGDAATLARAAVEGRLDVRADASRQPGDFRRIVQGVNDAIDALVAPIRELAAVLDRLAAGDLAARAEPGRHQHESRHLLEGVNATLAALLAPTQEATEVLGRLASRDLRARMTGHYLGGHAQMKTALNATAQALDEALSQVAQAAAQVSSASNQIAASSQAVASGANEQAASLEQTTATIASVSSIARQASDSSQQANALAQTARNAACEGAAAVEQMQGAMYKIRSSAEGTAQIIRDINDIAFQTNLLALNAAVEAARAGEAGRGFSVVAEEVRSLARRAKEAATKTEDLIRQSVSETGAGELASREVAEKLDEILGGIGRVSDIVQEISQAAREQAHGIEQVTTALSEMEKITQQNAASAQESSSAAGELSGQSEELAAMVRGFELSGLRRPHAPAAAALAAPVATRRNGAAEAPPAAADPFPMGDDAPLRDF